MHVAAAQRRPCIAIMTGVDDPARWRPLGDHTTVLTDRVPCAPCYRSRGCAAMSCIRGVSTTAVLDAVAPYLPG
jgi:ADP-heptose:LPS heptosyltransferase